MIQNRELIQIIRTVDAASAQHALNGHERLLPMEGAEEWRKELLIDSGGSGSKGRRRKWAVITIEVREEER